MATPRTQPGAAHQQQASPAAISSPSEAMKKFMAEIERQWRHVKVVVERQLTVASSPESVEITISTLPQDDLTTLMIHRACEEYQADSTFFRPGSNGEVLESDPGAPRRFVAIDRTVETVLPENLLATRNLQRTPLSTTSQTPQLLIPTQLAVATLQPVQPTLEEDEKAWDILDDFVQRNGWVQVFDRFTISQWRGIVLRHLREADEATVGPTAVAPSQPSASARAIASVQDSAVGVDPTGRTAQDLIPPRQGSTNGNQQRPARTLTSAANARSAYMDAYAAQVNARRTASTRASTSSVGATYSPDSLAPGPSGNDQPRLSLTAQLPLDANLSNLAQYDAPANSRKKRKRSPEPEHAYNPPITFLPPSTRPNATPRGPSTKTSPTKDNRSPYFRDKTQQVHGTRKGFRTHGPPPHFDKHGGDQSAKLPFRYWLTNRDGTERLKEHHYKPSTTPRPGDSAAVRARKESLRAGIDWTNAGHMRLLNEWVNQILWRHGCPVVRADMRDKLWSAEEDEAFRDVLREWPGASHARCCRLYVERWSGREMRMRSRASGVVEVRRVPVRSEQAVYSHANAKKLWLDQAAGGSGAGAAPAAAGDGLATAQTAQTAQTDQTDQPAVEVGSAASAQPAAGAVEPAGAESEDEWASTDEEEVEDEDDIEKTLADGCDEANASPSANGM